ncbi:MAG: triose-phosphate isomerase, partial [Deltaproteobacteria bacterium]|nr:triose-phosphate isomerase [Deltaproteobacteria bacterium]
MSSQDRRPLIMGNWKMHKTGVEAAAYIEHLKTLLPSKLEVDVGVAPSFTALETALAAANDSPILIAAQNVFWEEQGAYTGEVSVLMLLGLGVEWVILGHSERRQYFNETDETVNRRVKAALAHGLHPIVCIGETLEQREAGQTYQVLENQLNKALAGLSAEAANKLTIAYEPVWAIGTGRTATPEIAQEAHGFIRAELEKILNKELANSIRILYGGSVKPENAAELLAQVDIDGALVGGASLKPDIFFG